MTTYDPMTTDSTTRVTALLVGWTAFASSLLYLASDVVELAQGGFSPAQLAITYAAEASIPLFVLGLYAMQRPQIGRLGLIGATVYAYSFVFFTGTVVYAIVEDVENWDSLSARLGAWIGVHSVLMVAAGIAFGVAVVRARVFPPMTGVALVAGMALMAATVSLPAAAQVGAAAVRDLAFAAMGLAVLRSRRDRQPVPVTAKGTAPTTGWRSPSIGP